MKKFITVLFVLIIAQAIVAQRSIDGLVQAEKDFAAYSVSHSTKEAFLEYLDSAGVIFDNGKAVNGIEVWNKREKRAGVLNWKPAFAEISKSNDFGYTSGPWTFQASATDTIVARGQYTTVWHINKNGEWKFLVDLGVNNTPKNSDTLLLPLGDYKATGGSLESLLKTENDFIGAAAGTAKKAYKEYMSTTAVISRNHLGAQYAQWKNETFKEKVQCTVTGSGMASSGDLGYVYGTTLIDGKTDNYLRIWRREGKKWKIVLEVLRY